MNKILLTDFDYQLPDELIAKYPLPQRSESRLLRLNAITQQIEHQQFFNLTRFLNSKDLIVFNNTKVIPARLLGQKATGGKIEVLVERILEGEHFLAHVRASKSPPVGSYLYFDNQKIVFEVLGKDGTLYTLRSLNKSPLAEIIEAIGLMPIPPYFQRSAEEIDHNRYQTVYATHKGSVAAPTAGLHFDEETLKKIAQLNIETEFVTLHVGAGTFAPVRVDDITQHKMHKEYLNVSPALCEKIRQTKMRGGRVVAVGTTTVRSLETASRNGEIHPYQGETDIFIYPGFKFNCVDALITNFHLPGSSLIMLVAAFAGLEVIKKIYQVAIEEKYRFFSYGDAMCLGL